MAKEQGQSGKTGILLYSAWFVSLVAMLGSLYFSEVQGFIPCELCWYQRIAMYPLVLILGIATFTNDTKAPRYVLPLSLLGGSISVLHYLEQKFQGLVDSSPVSMGSHAAQNTSIGQVSSRFHFWH